MEKTIDYKVNEMLSQMMELQKQLQIANENNTSQKTKKKKKRREGSYELYGNGKARLYYMHNRIAYRETIEAEDEEDAEKKLALFVDSVKKGNFINTNYTFAEWAQIWLDNKIRPNCGERCVDKYIGFLNNRILPAIGTYKLKDLTKQIIESYLNKLKKEKTNYKNRKENKTLSPETIKKIKNIIHSCIEYAVECELLHKNVCDKIKINHTNTTDEKVLKKLAESKIEKINYYRLDEYKNIIKLLENEFIKYYNDNFISNEVKLREIARRLIILIALKTGMRRSEIFGLARSDDYNDLDLEKCQFSVNKSRQYVKNVGKYTKYPKSSSSIREKSLPKSLISFIELYYNLLDKFNYKEMYIFDHLSIDGTCAWFSKWQEKNNINKIRFHDLRHTHATMLLYQGVDVKTISERLGHADINTTLNIYADVLKELDTKAASLLDEI